MEDGVLLILLAKRLSGSLPPYFNNLAFALGNQTYVYIGKDLSSLCIYNSECLGKYLSSLPVFKYINLFQ